MIGQIIEIHHRNGGITTHVLDKPRAVPQKIREYRTVVQKVHDLEAVFGQVQHCMLKEGHLIIIDDKPSFVLEIKPGWSSRVISGSSNSYNIQIPDYDSLSIE